MILEIVMQGKRSSCEMSSCPVLRHCMYAYNVRFIIYHKVNSSVAFKFNIEATAPIKHLQIVFTYVNIFFHSFLLKCHTDLTHSLYRA